MKHRRIISCSTAGVLSILALTLSLSACASPQQLSPQYVVIDARVQNELIECNRVIEEIQALQFTAQLDHDDNIELLRDSYELRKYCLMLQFARDLAFEYPDDLGESFYPNATASVDSLAESRRNLQSRFR